MDEMLRCPHCRHWTDALLVWASGDCCPSCNGPMSVPDHGHAGDAASLAQSRPAAEHGGGSMAVTTGATEQAGPTALNLSGTEAVGLGQPRLSSIR